MNDAWIGEAREKLRALRGNEPGWGYRPQGVPYVEPTVLASLALLATRSDEGSLPDEVADAANWLARIQQTDGSLGLSEALSAPQWTTSLAILLWSACGTHEQACQRAADWLTTQRGTTIETNSASPYGHDPTIPGWPWVAGTHSWLEPTALAVLALRRARRAAASRTIDGLRLIRDRAIRTGGWNYGNSCVFGADLRAQPAPTGLALVALSGIDRPSAPCVERGCGYLEKILAETRAAASLCWGLLALSAWGRRPGAADEWIQRAGAAVSRRSDPAMHWSCLLLAASGGGLPVLGLIPFSESAAP
jgi:hypothetical protein